MFQRCRCVLSCFWLFLVLFGFFKGLSFLLMTTWQPWFGAHSDRGGSLGQSWSVLSKCLLRFSWISPSWGHANVFSHQFIQLKQTMDKYLSSGESRIIFLPERSSICQYPPKLSAISIKKQSRARLLLAHPVLYILNLQKTYGTFWKPPFQNQPKSVRL